MTSKLKTTTAFNEEPKKENIKPECIFLSFLGSSLNAVAIFNLEVTHAARFALRVENYLRV